MLSKLKIPIREDSESFRERAERASREASNETNQSYVDGRLCRPGGRRRQRAGIGLWLSASVLLVFLYAHRAGQFQRHETNQQMTGAQVLEHFKPICKALFPQAAGLQVTAYPVFSRAHKIWTTSCMDGAGNKLAFMLWNADTCQLMGLTITRDVHNLDFQKIKDSGDALTTSKAWLRRLDMGKTAPKWSLTKVDQSSRLPVWYTRWEAPGQKIFVSLFAETGELRSLSYTTSSKVQ